MAFGYSSPGSPFFALVVAGLLSLFGKSKRRTHKPQPKLRYPSTPPPMPGIIPADVKTLNLSVSLPAHIELPSRVLEGTQVLLRLENEDLYAAVGGISVRVFPPSGFPLFRLRCGSGYYAYVKNIDRSEHSLTISVEFYN